MLRGERGNETRKGQWDMSKTYGIISNCNYESSDAITLARKAVESGRCDDETLVAALDNLESTLEDHCESGEEISVNACRKAEQAVYAAWANVEEAVVQ